MYCLTFELYSASAVWIFRLCINNILNRFDFITTIYTLYTRVIRSICYAKVPNMMNYKKKYCYRVVHFKFCNPRRSLSSLYSSYFRTCTAEASTRQSL